MGMLKAGEKISFQEFMTQIATKKDRHGCLVFAGTLLALGARVVLQDGSYVPVQRMFQTVIGHDCLHYMLLQDWAKEGRWKEIVIPEQLTFEGLIDLVRNKVRNGQSIELTEEESVGIASTIDMKGTSLHDALKELASLVKA